MIKEPMHPHDICSNWHGSRILHLGTTISVRNLHFEDSTERNLALDYRNDIIVFVPTSEHNRKSISVSNFLLLRRRGQLHTLDVQMQQ